jgi:hypothetical protein
MSRAQPGAHPPRVQGHLGMLGDERAPAGTRQLAARGPVRHAAQSTRGAGFLLMRRQYGARSFVVLLMPQHVRIICCLRTCIIFDIGTNGFECLESGVIRNSLRALFAMNCDDVFYRFAARTMPIGRVDLTHSHKSVLHDVVRYRYLRHEGRVLDSFDWVWGIRRINASNKSLRETYNWGKS